MDSLRRWMLAGAIGVTGFSTIYLTGCAHYHHHEEIVDDRGRHHTGYYDEHHTWHGGYVDERGTRHDDPGDWHH